MFYAPPKPNRNDPCYCNSGKKYKKCCINKPEDYSSYHHSDFTPSFSGTEAKAFTWVNKYNLRELLAMLAVIQLQPLNHGKNIRIEHLITAAIRANSKVSGAIDINALRKDLLRVDKHPHEDPPEDFFTENIQFSNGNNTVYPGIFIQATEKVQSQLDSLNHIRSTFIQKIHPILEGIYFLLHLHSKIASRLGHDKRMYHEAKSQSLFIPSDDELKQQSEHFIFTEEELRTLCQDIQIEPTIYQNFIYQGPLESLVFENSDESALFHTPFVKVDDRLVLVMPTAQLAVINHFIICQISAASLTKEFTHAFSRSSKSSTDALAKRMGWEQLGELQEPICKDDVGTFINQSLFQIDVDKLALISTSIFAPTSIEETIEVQMAGNKVYWTTLNQKARTIKEEYPGMQLFLVAVSDQINIFGTRILAVEAKSEFAQFIGLSINEFRVMTSNWSLGALSLWKYAKAREASYEQIMFTPFSTNVGIYKYFEDNHECFFHPDKQSANYVMIEFDVEGAINRSAKRKLDKIGILYPSKNGLVLISSIRKEEHLPIYLSEEYQHGLFRQCLMVYPCPIWVESDSLGHPTGQVYINAILYWLHTCRNSFEDFFSQFSELPIIIQLKLDEKLYDKSQWNIDSTDSIIEIPYALDVKQRKLEIIIPVDIISHFAQVGNGGELLLMAKIIELLGYLAKELTGTPYPPMGNLIEILEKDIPPGLKKMILITAVDFHDPVLADIDISHPKYIAEIDISNILMNQVSELGYSKPIPRKVPDNTEKGKILNDLVALHFKKVIESIHEFEAIPLLLFLMRRHEDLLQAREMRKLTFPTMQACYGTYYNVYEEFGKLEADSVSTSLALRTLIEFVACEMPKGSKSASHESVDELLARILELINYGALSDSIKYEVENPELGLLPSGRLGLNYGGKNKWLGDFRNDLYQEEFDKYQREFKHFFSTNKPVKKAQKGDSPYYDKIDEIFTKEWGVTLWDLIGMSCYLCWQLFDQGISVGLLSADQIIERIIGSSTNTKEGVEAFLQLLTFPERKGVLNLEKKKLHEAFPWRYNRAISYMLKPLIPVKVKDQTFYIISARHLFTASENIFARFMDGTLKVSEQHSQIQRLLAERNDIKGTEFRDKVCDFLKTKQNLQVIDFEVKIKPKGFFHSEVDKGDVDILCINHRKKTLYAIECKNTSQAKIAYDIFNEIRNYIGTNDKPGMIEKHVKRHQWLTENLDQVMATLKLSGNYKVESMVLTKHILPTRYLHQAPIPVYSYTDLVSGKMIG